MGLFSKKEKTKKPCPLCGRELTLLHALVLADGNEICDDCAKKLRDQFDVEHYWERTFWSDGDITVKRKSHDLLKDLSLDDVREVMAEKEDRKESVLAEADAAAGEYSAVFLPSQLDQIAPKSLEVGLARAKALKGAWVYKGTVLRGSFNQGDKVQVLASDGSLRPAEILELIPCDVTDFWTELKARTHKKTISEGYPAWIVLAASVGKLKGDEQIVK